MISSPYRVRGFMTCNISMIDACKFCVQKYIFICPSGDHFLRNDAINRDVLPWTDCAFIHLSDGAFGPLDWSQQAFRTVFRHNFCFYDYWLLSLRAMGMVSVWVDEFQSIFAAPIAQYQFLAKCADHADFSRKRPSILIALRQDIQFQFDSAGAHIPSGRMLLDDILKDSHTDTI